MKIRVIGDLHGRDWWKRKVETGDSNLNIFLGMLINTIITPTIEDYIHGKVRVEINQVYENGEVVRCDTNYYKL